MTFEACSRCWKLSVHGKVQLVTGNDRPILI